MLKAYFLKQPPAVQHALGLPSAQLAENVGGRLSA